MIKIAKNCGANAVKFQLFNAKKLYPNNHKMYKIFKSVELNSSWIKDLKKYSDKVKIDFICSAFDLESAKIVNKYVDTHKVASSEATNINLLKYLVKTKKKILFSTGMCDQIDINNFLKIVKKYKNNNIVLMQNGAIYPLPLAKTNLNVLNSFKKFKYDIGFSDHTLGYEAAMCASALGSTYFEKHFTLNKKSKGPDHFFASEPKDLKKYIIKINLAKKMLGSKVKEMLPEEKKYGRRNGLYYAKNILKGTKLTKNMLQIKQPALGMRARDIKQILGKKLKINAIKNNYVLKTHIKK